MGTVAEITDYVKKLSGKFFMCDECSKIIIWTKGYVLEDFKFHVGMCKCGTATYTSIVVPETGEVALYKAAGYKQKNDL